MIPLWHTLVANLAVVAFFFSVWASAQHHLQNRSRVVRHFVLGLIMGIGACSSMVLSVQLDPGAFVDLRSSLLATAGFFGGPIGAFTAGALAAAYRGYVGGQGLVAGLTNIFLAALVGLVAYQLRAGKPPSRRGILLFAVIVALIAILPIAALPTGLGEDALLRLGPPVALLTFTATVIAGLLIIQTSKIAADRDLLRAALTQAPDFQYVKGRDSRFAEVNQATATINGYSAPADMVGKTDFDLFEPDLAKPLFEAEQEVMRAGAPQLDRVERVVDGTGAERWFSTSKVPLRNHDGEIIGLAGVTRDVTEHRRLEAELRDSRNLLTFAVEEMSDGLAMFDREGRLVYCNDRYRGLFPLTGDIRKPGVHIREILQAVVATGEQLDLGDPETWIDTIANSLTIAGEEQVSLYDGRWLQVRTRPTAGGASMVVVSDVTTLKKSEGELRTLTRQLHTLATTDSLTGLMNRRAFDEVIVEELARTERDQSPLSLVLFDVDRFKAYNDYYGHPAGDDCLKEVSRCLRSELLRQRDVAARYGGEEFAVILPDTDEDRAFVVAERVRRSLADNELPHANSEFGIVTLSAGIATYDADTKERSAGQLISRADEALYLAKEAGRNRVTGWEQRRHERVRKHVRRG